MSAAGRNGTPRRRRLRGSRGDHRAPRAEADPEGGCGGPHRTRRKAEVGEAGAGVGGKPPRGEQAYPWGDELATCQRAHMDSEPASMDGNGVGCRTQFRVEERGAWGVGRGRACSEDFRVS